MLRTFISAYPWDLIDEGAATALDRLHGEVGVGGVSIRVATPAVIQLRARDLSPRIFRTRGGVFFHPRDEHYEGTRCKPIVSSWLKGRRPLERIAEACADRGMELRAMISAGLTGRLAQRYPEMACTNVFGDHSHVSLCLANPDVQAYLCGLVADLSSNRTVCGVTITDFQIGWAEAFMTDLRAARPSTEAEVSLLSVCFCESCHQGADAAGVDVPTARRSVEAILQESLVGAVDVDDRLGALLADRTPLADYYCRRAAELNSLLLRLAQACRCELLLDRPAGNILCRRGADLDWSVPHGVITRIDGPDELRSAVYPTAKRSELRLPETFVTGGHGPELVGTLAQAAERGFAGVEIDSYGLIPDASLTPIRQAIRFARRTGSGE